jgi:beta-lactamase class A
VTSGTRRPGGTVPEAGRWDELERLAEAAERDGLAGRVALAVRATGPDGTTHGWQRRGDAVFLSASTIKVAILVAVAHGLAEGRLRHDDRLAATPEETVGGSGVLRGLSPGLELSVDDHAWLMVAISDNTASNVLIRAVGLPAVAEVAADLGLAGTHLRRPFLGAIPTDHLPRNETTAPDLVALLAAVADDRAAPAGECAWMRGLLAQQQHLDRLGRDLPAGVAFAGKSGSLDGVTHDCAILTGHGGRVVVAVLTDGVTDRFAVDALLGRVGRVAAERAGLAG